MLTLSYAVGEDSRLERQVRILVVSVGPWASDGTGKPVTIAQLVSRLCSSATDDQPVQLKDIPEPPERSGEDMREAEGYPQTPVRFSSHLQREAARL